MVNLLKIPTGSFNLNLGNLSIPIPYWQAFMIVALVFVLIISLAMFRRHQVDWSFKGVLFGIFFGFLLALFLEGFLIIGGKTALTSVLGWKDAPPVITQALDSGRNQLIKVLGVDTATIPSSFAKNSVGVEGAVEVLQSLNPVDTKTVRAIFCK